MPSTFISPQMVTPTLIGRAAGGALSRSATSGPDSYPTYGLTTRFRVVIHEGDNNLGNWSSCKGLKVEFKYRQIQRGGDYTRMALLPERMEYDRITLERGIQKADAKVVQDWLKTVANDWMKPSFDTPKPYTATIALLDPTDNSYLVKWDLSDVFPVSWSGPSMSAGGSDAVATETLVLQHGGFLQ
jgi:phage tail-like protein